MTGGGSFIASEKVHAVISPVKGLCEIHQWCFKKTYYKSKHTTRLYLHPLSCIGSAFIVKYIELNIVPLLAQL